MPASFSTVNHKSFLSIRGLRNETRLFRQVRKRKGRGTTTKIIVKEKARFEGEFPSRNRECDCFSKFGIEAFNNELKFSSRRDQRHYYFQVLRVSTRVARVIVYREIPFIYGYNYRETFNRIELTLSNFQIGRSVV